MSKFSIFLTHFRRLCGSLHYSYKVLKAVRRMIKTSKSHQERRNQDDTKSN